MISSTNILTFIDLIDLSILFLSFYKFQMKTLGGHATNLVVLINTLQKHLFL